MKYWIFQAAFLQDNSLASSSFPIQHSMLDVRCSMFIFSVNLPQSLGVKITQRLWGLTQIKFQQQVHRQEGKQGRKEDGPDL